MFDVQKSASHDVITAEPYECGTCSWRGVGRSHARGEGVANAGTMGLTNHHAAEMARDEAEATAWSEAMSNVELAECPRCRSVARSAWFAWLRRQTVFATIIGLLTGMLLMLLYAVTFGGDGGGGVLASFLAGCVLGIGGGWVLKARGKLLATRTVRFEETSG